jgi:hypothetical protein
MNNGAIQSEIIEIVIYTARLGFDLPTKENHIR